jgi:hypothetical protein
MMRRLVRLLVVGLVCAYCPFALAVQTMATGIGKTPAEALANAKLVALSQTAGSFISGRESTDGGSYQSNTREFHGGYIRQLAVISNELGRDGLHRATIRADVDPEKSNTRLETNGADIPTAWATEVERSTDEHTRIAAALIAVEVDRVSLRNLGGTTEIDVDVRIMWQPKWVDDLRVFAKAVGRKVDIDSAPSSFLIAMAALSAVVNPMLPLALFPLATATEKKVEISETPAVCFGPDSRADVESCHELRHTLPRVTGSSHVMLRGEWVFEGERRSLGPIAIDTEGQLFGHVRAGQEICFERGGKRLFGNPGVLLFRGGKVLYRQTYTLPSTDAARLKRVEFIAG